jgi:hypothetical protein
MISLIEVLFIELAIVAIITYSFNLRHCHNHINTVHNKSFINLIPHLSVTEFLKLFFRHYLSLFVYSIVICVNISKNLVNPIFIFYIDWKSFLLVRIFNKELLVLLTQKVTYKFFKFLGVIVLLALWNSNKHLFKRNFIDNNFFIFKVNSIKPFKAWVVYTWLLNSLIDSSSE